MTSGSATQVPQAGDLVELKAPTVTIPNKLLVLAEEMFEERCFLLRCISPLLADIVAEGCDYSSEAAASIPRKGSHHPLFCGAVTLIKGH